MANTNPKQLRRDETGMGLILVMLALFALSVMVAGMMLVIQTESWSSFSYKALTQARYISEAGAQSAVNWFENNYTAPANTAGYTMTTVPVQYNGQPVVLSAMTGVSSNYSDATVSSAFSTAMNGIALTATGVSGTYSVKATMLRFPQGSTTGLWQITATGSVSAPRKATVQEVVTVESPAAAFQYAVYATGTVCKALNFSSNAAATDSWNSSSGTYAATKQSSGGNVGTNGNINLSGGATIHGTFSGLNVGNGS